MAYPTSALTSQMAQMNMQPIQRAGHTPLLAMFGEGNLIGLHSVTTGQNVNVVGAEVCATGGNEPHAQFVVRVCRPGVVSLQSARQNIDWLAIYEGRAIGNGRGGPFSEFTVLDFTSYVVLESTQYPGQRLGFYPDGRSMPPAQTPVESAGLTPVVHNYAGETPNPEGSAPPQPSPYQSAVPQGPPQGSYFPPPQGNPPPQGYAPPQGHAPPQGYAPQGHPPPQGYAHPQGHPPPQGYAPPQGSVVPQQSYAPPPSLPASVLPAGFSVMDAFRTGNIISLISKSSGSHVNITKGDVHVSGRFGHNESLFIVTIAANNGVILQNVQWAGLHIGIKKNNIEAHAKKDKVSTLKATPLSDNYIYFESIEYPGCYLGFSSDGKHRKAKEVGPAEADAQFFVRVERQKHIITIPTIPYNRPSIYAFVRCDSIIQLYLKGVERYLSIDKLGNPRTLTTPNDQYSFFLWKDRGMGIVSLVSYKSPAGFMMRMGGYVVTGKGDPDLNSDFRVHETIGGGVKFESVTCPGGFLAIDNGGAAVQEMYIQLITIQKFGKSETITKQPIN